MADAFFCVLLVAELCVFHREHIPLEGDVLRLVFEGSSVIGDLLLGECFDGSSCLGELRLSGEFCVREGFGSRIADFAGAKGASAALEVDVRVGTEFSSELFDEVNRFETCHSRFVLIAHVWSIH